MNREDIKALALANGFSLKEQPNGEMDLNPYVYQFAEALAKQSQESAVLKKDCMIEQTWFPQGTLITDLVEYAANVYKATAIAQNSKIQFGTDDNEHWWAHDVPYYGTVQLSKIIEHGITEWDMPLDGCWQGPFSSMEKAIVHLEECIKEKREESEDA